MRCVETEIGDFARRSRPKAGRLSGKGERASRSRKVAAHGTFTFRFCDMSARVVRAGALTVPVRCFLEALDSSKLRCRMATMSIVPSGSVLRSAFGAIGNCFTFATKGLRWRKRRTHFQPVIDHGRCAEQIRSAHAAPSRFQTNWLLQTLLSGVR